jgi:hypothetical protein
LHVSEAPDNSYNRDKPERRCGLAHTDDDRVIDLIFGQDGRKGSALITCKSRESVSEYSSSCMDMRLHDALNSAKAGPAAARKGY